MTDIFTYIVIPARYNSSRFPGKPLAMLGTKTLLGHVCHAAQQVSKVKVLVATDDDRILQHAQDIGVEAVMTPAACATGTDRVLAAINAYEKENKPAKPIDFIINLQGDAPLTPPGVLQDIQHELHRHAIVTPVIQLSWDMLDILREAKRTTPFSGTAAIINNRNEALWFSKQIIPALRNETELRKKSAFSPIYQHIGIYGYTRAALEKFVHLPPSPYEQLEGLEQLRLLENDLKINVVKLDHLYANAWRGVDTPEDLAFVAQILKKTQA